MTNDIRAALNAWLPLISGLSFDERVGFITAIFCGNCQPGPQLNDDLRRAILHNRDKIDAAMRELQTEKLRQANERQYDLLMDIVTPLFHPQERTIEDRKKSLALAIKREDWKASARIAKELRKL